LETISKLNFPPETSNLAPLVPPQGIIISRSNQVFFPGKVGRLLQEQFGWGHYSTLVTPFFRRTHLAPPN